MGDPPAGTPPPDPDVALEIALDEVLAWHEIPLNLPNGDRGDLASDLAAAARHVLEVPR